MVAVWEPAVSDAVLYCTAIVSASPVEVPLAEDSERYDNDILDGATVKRTLVATTPSVADGQRKRPRSSRLAYSEKPSPSCQRIFTR